MVFYSLQYILAPRRNAVMKLIGTTRRSEPIRCVDCGAWLGPLIRLPPYRYKISNEILGDFLSDGMTIAFSRSFTAAFLKSKLKGLSFSDIPIEFSNVDAIYFIGFVKYTRTLLDESASGVVIDEFTSCNNCRVMSMKKLLRVVINEVSWDGSDIFLSGNLQGEILVTQRFVDFVHEYNFTGFTFVHQDDIHFDYSGI